MTDDKIRKIMEKYKVPEKDQEPIILAINNAVEKHRVSKKLIVAIIAKESSFKKRVVSKHGALGLMQVMPMHHISKPFDIHLNVDKGTELLASYIEDAGSLNGGLAKYGNSSHYIYEIQVTLNRIQKIAGT